MTDTVYCLLCVLLAGKQPDDFVFTHRDGTPVRIFGRHGGMPVSGLQSSRWFAAVVHDH